MKNTNSLRLYEEILRNAFRAARYRFGLPDGELLLAVDTPDPRLSALLRTRGVDGMAVLTAFNPHGRQQDDSRNRASQQLLQDELSAGALEFLHGQNEDPTGRWPVEDSLLVLGISLALAQDLAARHGQLAFLWSDAASATPRLVETGTKA